MALSQSIRDVAFLRKNFRKCASNYSPEAKQLLHEIREILWANEQFCTRMMALLNQCSLSASGSTLSAIRREITYFRPEGNGQGFWLVYGERKELVQSLRTFPVTILSACEQAGKTSQVPLYLYDRED